MARSTLPEFDPLAELGIGQRAQNEAEPRSSPRAVRPQVASKPERIPIGDSNAPLTEPQLAGAQAHEVPMQTGAETPVSQPRMAGDAEGPQARARPKLTLTSSTPAVSGVPKAKTSSRIAADIFEEVRDCVVWHGHAMTIDSFTEAAFREHLKRLRRQHDLGERFPVREREPKQGRRVS